MKIFAVSDIHSYYTILKNALNKAGFEKNNPNHLLVVCGDMFDRGDESQQVLDYLLSVKNKILIMGNHEELFVECCQRGFAYDYDFRNRTHKTICDLAPQATTFIGGCEVAYHKVKPLLNQMVNYFETENYIFVHSWIACNAEDDYPKYYTRDREFMYDPDWRCAHYSAWETARWGNPFNMSKNGLNQTGKIIVHGHWQNSTGWANQGYGKEFGLGACFDICKHNNCIGLDACTAYSQKMNVLVIEDNLLEVTNEVN